MSRFTSTKSVGLSQAAGSISMTDERAPVMDNLDSLDPSLERTFRGHKSVVTSVAFKPDLKQIASGSSDCS
jgi:centriolar protein POC1